MPGLHVGEFFGAGKSFHTVHGVRATAARAVAAVGQMRREKREMSAGKRRGVREGTFYALEWARGTAVKAWA